MQSRRRFATILSLCCLLLFFSSLSYSVDLKPNTVTAFDRYVSATEGRMTNELRAGGAFLYIDSLAPARRDSAYRQLAAREVFISPLQTTEGGKSISIPDGIVHHWVGIIFIPNR